jgi:hypothetical protein
MSANVLAQGGSRSTGEFIINDAPTTPSQLDAKTLKVLPDGKILTEFTWQPSSDDHTPSEGLTYALKVGTTSGGEDIISPNANQNGIRKTSEKGNAEHNLKWRLALTKGNYYWSVQAVDASYAGSAFTATQKVSVTSTVGKDELETNNQLVTYPNPTSGLFKIIIPGTEDMVKVAIQSANGSIITESTMHVPTNRALNMNISNLKPGVYMIRIQSDKLNHMVKIVKN